MKQNRAKKIWGYEYHLGRMTTSRRSGALLEDKMKIKSMNL